MPRVHTQVAAKNYPQQGINKGDTYYKWEFRNGGPIRSATYPQPWQLTQSPYLQTLYQIEHSWDNDRPSDNIDETVLQEFVDGIKDRIEELREETQEKLDNMAQYGLENSPSGELLQERVDMLENTHSELDCLSFEEFEEDSIREEISDDLAEDYEEGEVDELKKAVDAELEDKRTEHWQEQLDQLDNVTIEG